MTCENGNPEKPHSAHFALKSVGIFDASGKLLPPSKTQAFALFTPPLNLIFHAGSEKI
jgi:hypothetical protein